MSEEDQEHAYWKKLREEQFTRDRENHQNLKRIADSLEKLGDRLEKLTDSMMKVGEIVTQAGPHAFGIGVPVDEDEPDGTTSEAVFLDLLKVVEKSFLDGEGPAQALQRIGELLRDHPEAPDPRRCCEQIAHVDSARTLLETIALRRDHPDAAIFLKRFESDAAVQWLDALLAFLKDTIARTT